MSTYTLGQPVRFTRHLHRRFRGGYSTGDPARKVWETEAYPGAPEPKPRDGLVIGVRTLSNGDWVNLGWEDGIAFRPREHFRAYLIAFDLRRRPVLVLPEHMECAS